MAILVTISLTRLTSLEFGQFISSTVSEIILVTAANPIKDDIFTKYLTDLGVKSTLLDKAVMQIRKNDETAKIAAQDVRRDHAVTTAHRANSVFEFTDDPDEHNAYLSVETVFITYKGIQDWDLPEETKGIEKMVTELTDEKHASFVELLGLTKHINKMQAENQALKSLFEGRSVGEAGKEVLDAKSIRKDTRILYEDMASYVLSIAKGSKQQEFINVLNVLNNIRKYYSDMLAKRKTPTQGEPPTPIPPMPKA